MHSGVELRSGARRPWRALAGARIAKGLAAALITAALLTPAGAAVSPQDAQPTETQVTAAVAQLKKDPNLATTEKTRTLRWVDKPQQDKPDSSEPGWIKWLRGFFAWIAESGRLVLWVAGGLLAALLALYIKRLVEARNERILFKSFTAPTHVRDLDIRPETLPDDIGAAALERWERGEHRPALALLYRGLLSRLAHVHGVPIKHSSTEGDVMELTERHLSAVQSQYTSRLVRVWQRAVYGGAEPSSEDVLALCAEFSAALDAPQSQARLTEQPA